MRGLRCLVAALRFRLPLRHRCRRVSIFEMFDILIVWKLELEIEPCMESGECKLRMVQFLLDEWLIALPINHIIWSHESHLINFILSKDMYWKSQPHIGPWTVWVVPLRTILHSFSFFFGRSCSIMRISVYLWPDCAKSSRLRIRVWFHFTMTDNIGTCTWHMLTPHAPKTSDWALSSVQYPSWLIIADYTVLYYPTLYREF